MMNEACCGEWGRNLFHCHSNLLVLPFLFNIHSLGTLPFVLKFVFRKLHSTCSFRKRNQLISINLHLRLIQDLYIKDYAKTFFPQIYKSWKLKSVLELLLDILWLKVAFHLDFSKSKKSLRRLIFLNILMYSKTLPKQGIRANKACYFACVL